MIMATSSRGVKPHTVQPQSAACESTLAPGSTVAQHHLRLILPRDNPPFRPRNGCFGDPTKEKEQLRNSSLSDRSRENSRRPQGMRRTPPVSAHVCRRARSSNAQHRTDFKSKRAQGRSGLCCSRCFCFHRPRTGTLCPPSRCAAAQVPPLLAPLSPPAISSSTHTHNAQVPVPSMPHPIARATIPRFARALFAVSASPPALLLHVHRCARSQLITQQRTAHQPLRVFCASNTRNAQAPASPVFQPHCANAAPHRCSRSACSSVRQAHASTPILQLIRLSSPCAIAK
jgi:hypothetical protein